MFERIVSQHEATCITSTLCYLGKADMCLSIEEKETISNSLIVLKPFLQATKEISGEKYISISMIIPISKLLMKATANGPDIPLRSLLQWELTKRFSQLEQRYTIAVSTLLDQRFKKLAFSDTSAVDRAVRRLQNEVLTILSTAGESLQSSGDQPSGTEEQSSATAQEEQGSHKRGEFWAVFDEGYLEQAPTGLTLLMVSQRSGGTSKPGLLTERMTHLCGGKQMDTSFLMFQCLLGSTYPSQDRQCLLNDYSPKLVN